MKRSQILILITILLAGMYSWDSNAQQDAQYTQYMYNTMSINPAYAGSRETLSVVGLHRSQWVGLRGAPRTQTISMHSPIGDSKRVGLGLNVVKDDIFITSETYIDLAFSYTVPTSDKGKLSFGLKGGAHLLDVNYNAASAFQSGDVLLSNNIDNRFSPQVGVGLFYYQDNFYGGLSAPNLLETDHFDSGENSNDPNATFLAQERVNYYATVGYVFDLSPSFKLKPAVLAKWVAGAPFQLDVTANALIAEKFTVGAAWRWSAALSGLVGFQLTDSLMLGFAYDRETTDLQQYNDGSYEVFLRFEVFNKSKKLISPRFF